MLDHDLVGRAIELDNKEPIWVVLSQPKRLRGNDYRLREGRSYFLVVRARIIGNALLDCLADDLYVVDANHVPNRHLTTYRLHVLRAQRGQPGASASGFRYCSARTQAVGEKTQQSLGLVGTAPLVAANN